MIKSVFNLLGIVAAMFAACKYGYIVKDFLVKRTNVYDFVLNNVTKRIVSLLGDSVADIPSPREIFSGFDMLPFDYQNAVNNIFNQQISEQASKIGTDISIYLSGIMMTVISFVITLAASYLVMIFAVGILNTMFKVPGLNAANKFLGGIFGILKTVIILYFVFALATPFIAISKDKNMIVDEILESKSSKFLYENNLVLNYLAYKDINIELINPLQPE